MATTSSDKAENPWSEMEVVDLQSGLAFGASLEEIARFLARDLADVREKAASDRCSKHPTFSRLDGGKPKTRKHFQST
jgi:hypothetical protein